MKRVLVTGGAGFVGSHVVRHLLTETDWHLVLPVSFRHKGNGDRLKVATEDHPDWDKRMTVIHHDLRGPFSLTQMHEMGQIDTIFNLASESHVDRSITDPVSFITNNTYLILNMLELARAIQPEKFIQISTDEVYGPAYGDHRHAEWESHIPSNPYSASKSAQESIAISYWRTYGVPLILTNTMNIIGETQDREKFLPMLIRASEQGETVPIHVDEEGVSGSRFYLHARNQADALLFIDLNVFPDMYPKNPRPERLHIVGELEVSNFLLVNMVREITGKPIETLPVSFHSSRPGHDLRYALDGSKLEGYGWTPPVPFDASLDKTVRWTLDHPEWLL